MFQMGLTLVQTISGTNLNTNSVKDRYVLPTTSLYWYYLQILVYLCLLFRYISEATGMNVKWERRRKKPEPGRQRSSGHNIIMAPGCFRGQATYHGMAGRRDAKIDACTEDIMFPLWHNKNQTNTIFFQDFRNFWK